MKFLGKIFSRWYIIIGFLIFFYIVFYKIDVSKVLETLSKTNPYLVGLVILLVFSMSLVQPARWNYLKKVQNINYRLKDSFLIYNAGFFFSAITPGHLGDLIKIFYLKKDGHSVGKSLVSVLLDRASDILFLLLVGYVSMYFFAQFFLKYIITITIVGLSVLLFIFIFQRKKFLKIAFQKIILSIIPVKYQKSWHLNYHDFVISIAIYKFKNYFILSLVTIFNWFIYYLSVFLLAKSIGLDNIPFIFLAMSITLATLATLIPISIFGLGTRDASLLFFFSFFGVSPEQTISFSTLYLLMLLITASIGFICWLKKPLRFRS